MKCFVVEAVEQRRLLAVTASFTPATGTLTVIGDAAANTITVSRDLAGQILVNNGAVTVVGGTPTVANTSLISVFGLDSDDTITLNEANGALPASQLFGGAGNDVLTGGSGADSLSGDIGNDTELGKGGIDTLSGGPDNDILTGGDGDDQVFGDAGNDRMIWNPGDDTDLNEGGTEIDTTEVNGGNGAETFTLTPNGTRVRFDRTTPAPFTIDIGTTENLTLNMNGGDDIFTGANGLSTLITLTVDGGTGNDSITGGDGNDFLLGGDNNDTVIGGRGNDTALMGANDDTFVWNPGEGSDIVEGQDGADTLQFNGANIAEKIDVSANGNRMRFTRDVAAITMDCNDVETVNFRALGGADTVTVNDMTGTDVTHVNVDLAATAGGTTGDGAVDSVIVNGTTGDDVITETDSPGSLLVSGLATNVQVSNFEPTDIVKVQAQAGNDIIDASAVDATGPSLIIDGGVGNDILQGGAGADNLLGGDDDDVLLGNAGADVLDGGLGENILLQDAGNANSGIVSVFGDGTSNTITISRDAAGNILNNGVPILGATVANTALIRVFGLAGNDTITFSEVNGALPAAALYGGDGNDVLTGGSGADLLFGGVGNDTELGKGGTDLLFGGADSDVLTGGDGDDQSFAEAGDDRMIWNPGDDTDLNEGGSGLDTVEVNGGNGTEQFTVTANGTRVRFDRINPAPFFLDIGTSESLDLNCNGGDDSLSCTGGLSTLISISVDGGTGNDTLLGSNGADFLIGGDGDDFIDGNQGNDTALMGANNDTFNWDPGDGSDIVEGQDGADTLQFNGANIAEKIDLSANGGRLRFTRDVAAITMDCNDVETVNFRALGGADTVTVNDLTGTDVTQVNVDLAGTPGGSTGDAAADVVNVNGTGGNDNALMTGDAAGVHVMGMAAVVNVTTAELANDRVSFNGQLGTDTLTMNGTAGADSFAFGFDGLVVFAQQLSGNAYTGQADATTENLLINCLAGNDTVTGGNGVAGHINVTLDGGDNNDSLVGGDENDLILAGNGDDTAIGGRGNDTALLGADNDTFVWNPGDGSDVVEGQAGADTLQFNGANVAERIEMSANGNRLRFTRDIANVLTDCNDVETVNFRALGGADNVIINDLSPTDVQTVNVDLSGSVGGGDAAADTVTIFGSAAANAIDISGNLIGMIVSGLPWTVTVGTPESANDNLVVHPGGGGDSVQVNNVTLGNVVNTITIDQDSDAFADSVQVDANGNANMVTIDDLTSGTEVVGLTTRVVVLDADPTLDTLQLNTFGGSDTISVNQNGVAGAVRHVFINAGSEQDFISVVGTPSDGFVGILPSGGDDSVVVNSDNVFTARVSFEGTQRLGQLTINNGGLATLPAGGAKVLTVTSLSMGITGALNLTDNDLIVDYTGGSPIATIGSLLTFGRGSGAWNAGSGITTSLGNASNFSLGYAEASDVAPGGTFSGQSVDTTAVLVKYTYSGDANLDGRVNVTDLGRLASNWQQSNRRWAQGEFSYDGAVNVSDLGALATNWQAGAIIPLARFGLAPAPIATTPIVTTPIAASIFSDEPILAE